MGTKKQRTIFTMCAVTACLITALFIGMQMMLQTYPFSMSDKVVFYLLAHSISILAFILIQIYNVVFAWNAPLPKQLLICEEAFFLLIAGGFLVIDNSQSAFGYLLIWSISLVPYWIQKSSLKGNLKTK